jgi:hypothetical protein
MKTTHKALLLAGLAFLAPAAPAQAPPAGAKADGKPVVVPFELLPSRHMAVQVTVNGKGPYRLVFDTGAPTNLINNRLAKDAGVMKKGDAPAMPLFGMGGAKTLDTLELGGVKLEKVPVMVMDHPTVTAMSKALGPIDGIVGFPFFARYKTTVDYQKKELTFTPNGYVPDDVMQALMQKMMGGGKKPEPRVAAPAGVWGFAVEKAGDDEDAGVKVTEVLAGSPAAAAGLKAGDRLLTLDGRWTDSVADTFTAASLVKPGRKAAVVVARGGKEVKLTVTPAKGV